MNIFTPRLQKHLLSESEQKIYFHTINSIYMLIFCIFKIRENKQQLEVFYILLSVKQNMLLFSDFFYFKIDKITRYLVNALNVCVTVVKDCWQLLYFPFAVIFTSFLVKFKIRSILLGENS